MGSDQEQRITLPYPPSVNHSHRYGRKSVYKSPKYRAWIRSAGWELKFQKVEPYLCAVEIELLLTPPDRIRRDADNTAKAVLDLLRGMCVIIDDSSKWVHATTQRWSGNVAPPGHVEVRIWPSPVDNLV